MEVSSFQRYKIGTIAQRLHYYNYQSFTAFFVFNEASFFKGIKQRSAKRLAPVLYRDYRHLVINVVLKSSKFFDVELMCEPPTSTL